MSRTLIPKLTALLKEGGKKDRIEMLEECIVEELEEYIEDELFYELFYEHPTNKIIKIVDKSSIKNIEMICSVISKRV